MNYQPTAVCAPPSNDHARCCGFGADGTECGCACHQKAPLTDDEVDAFLAITLPPDAARLERIRQKFIERQENAGCWLRHRCYACGHQLRFASTACPQCGEDFDGREAPRTWPKTCDCARCSDEALAHPQASTA